MTNYPIIETDCQEKSQTFAKNIFHAPTTWYNFPHGENYFSKTSSMVNKMWDTSLYDQKHAFVYAYGKDLIPLLQPQPGELILDLGCGTGHLTYKIAESGAHVIGIDSSVNMIATAQRNYPHLEFQVADARDFFVRDSF